MREPRVRMLRWSRLGKVLMRGGSGEVVPHRGSDQTSAPKRNAHRGRAMLAFNATTATAYGIPYSYLVTPAIQEEYGPL